VIGYDLNGMWGGFQEGAPFLEGTDNCKKFFVIDLIVNLGWETLLEKLAAG
jgi:hypothetical protein